MFQKQAPAAENEANPATAVSTPIGKNEAKAVSAASTVKSEVVKPEETKVIRILVSYYI